MFIVMLLRIVLIGNWKSHFRNHIAIRLYCIAVLLGYHACVLIQNMQIIDIHIAETYLYIYEMLFLFGNDIVLNMKT